jgi:hypothetical protein
MNQERRTEERKVVSWDARWEGLSGWHAARVGDISLGGCFIETFDPVEVGDIVTFEIKLPDGEWLPLRGEVTYYQPQIGFSVCFTFLTDEEQYQLSQIVNQ